MPSRWKRLWMLVILVTLTGLSLLSLDSVLAPSQQVARCTCTCCTYCTCCTWLASRSWVKCATLLELLSAMLSVLLGCFGCLGCLSGQTVAKKPRFWLMVATVSSCDSSCCVRCSLCGSPAGSATSALGAARNSPAASTKFQPEGAQGTRRTRRKVVQASPCSGHWFSRWHSPESGGAKYHPRGARVLLPRATTEGIQKGTFSTSTSLNHWRPAFLSAL